MAAKYHTCPDCGKGTVVRDGATTTCVVCGGIMREVDLGLDPFDSVDLGGHVMDLKTLRPHYIPGYITPSHDWGLWQMLSPHINLDPGYDYDMEDGTVEQEKEVPPTIMGSVIGYRAWRIVGRGTGLDAWGPASGTLRSYSTQARLEDWVLCGTGTRKYWNTGVYEATCDSYNNLQAHHQAPHYGCHCGIHALARFNKSGDGYWFSPHVIGAIEAWSENLNDYRVGDLAHEVGVVRRHCKNGDDSDGFIVCPPGFRARYAKVILLAIDDEYSVTHKKIIRHLAKQHGADVCKLEHLEDAAKEHGQLLPDSTLEWAKPEPGEHNFDISGWNTFAVVGPALAQSMSQMAWSASMFADSVGKIKNIFNAFNVSLPKPERVTTPRVGISQHLKTVGPPFHGKYKLGQRIKDRRGDVYECISAGKPGTWILSS